MNTTTAKVFEVAGTAIQEGRDSRQAVVDFLEKLPVDTVKSIHDELRAFIPRRLRPRELTKLTEGIVASVCRGHCFL